MSDFTPIMTQEELDKALSARLERERRKYADYDELKAKAAGYDELAGRVAGFETSDAEYKRQLAELREKETASSLALAEKDAKIRAYETASVKTRIAREYGIPFELADRLSGEDEDAIRKDAETVRRMIGGFNTAPMASSEMPAADTKRAALRETLTALKGE